VSLAIWDHAVLPSTRHKRTHPAFTPARQAGTRFTDHLRMEGWVRKRALENSKTRTGLLSWKLDWQPVKLA